MEMENTTSDLITVFGANSAEVQEAITDSQSPDPKVRAQPAADFEGIAIHCAAGDQLCSAANGGVADVLPQEPFGYTGFSGLFGHKFVAPAINGGDPALQDLLGNVITDSRGNIGFPGFGPITAAQTLAYTAAMHEQGVPVTLSYISDAHDGPTRAFGPGEAGYVARLATYDAAWGTFFARLAADGITKDNSFQRYSQPVLDPLRSSLTRSIGPRFGETCRTVLYFGRAPRSVTRGRIVVLRVF
jgi:hypothetical protein